MPLPRKLARPSQPSPAPRARPTPPGRPLTMRAPDLAADPPTRFTRQGEIQYTPSGTAGSSAAWDSRSVRGPAVNLTLTEAGLWGGTIQDRAVLLHARSGRITGEGVDIWVTQEGPVVHVRGLWFNRFVGLDISPDTVSASPLTGVCAAELSLAPDGLWRGFGGCGGTLDYIWMSLKGVAADPAAEMPQWFFAFLAALPAPQVSVIPPWRRLRGGRSRDRGASGTSSTPSSGGGQRQQASRPSPARSTTSGCAAPSATRVNGGGPPRPGSSASAPPPCPTAKCASPSDRGGTAAPPTSGGRAPPPRLADAAGRGAGTPADAEEEAGVGTPADAVGETGSPAAGADRQSATPAARAPTRRLRAPMAAGAARAGVPAVRPGRPEPRVRETMRSPG